MSYEEFEKSRMKGDVITYYHFFYINNQQFFYTDAGEVAYLPDNATPFEPIPIQHGNISTSGTLDKANLEIKIGRNVPITEGFRTYPPNEVVNVIIRQKHYEDPQDQALVVWSGRVVAAAWENSEVKLTCEPISTSLRRTGLRRHYQHTCPHVLYGPQCRANKDAATIGPMNVEYVQTGNQVVLPYEWLPADWAAAGRNGNHFIGGLISWITDTEAGPVETKRTILKFDLGRIFTIAGSLDGVVLGTQVKLTLGCNHQMDHCENLHNNIKNYGGQPWIPTKNPFSSVNQYY